MKKLVLLAGMALALGGVANGEPRNPTSEQAFYNLDKDPARTSSMIESGNVLGKVIGPGKDADSFQVDLNYNLVVDLIGNYNGVKSIDVPTTYFTEDFLVQLREEGTYETPKFKMKHMGFDDAVNPDGHSYPHCDLVLIYDIQTKQFDFLKRMLIADAKGDLEDFEILAHIKYGVPVLGAVKLDMKGKYDGMDLKAGADYVPQ